MAIHSNRRRHFDISINSFFRTLLQGRRRVLILALVLAAIIFVFCWNSGHPPPPRRIRVPHVKRKPETLGLKFVVWNGTNYLMPLCKSPRLGPFLVDLTGYELELLEMKYPEVQSGQYSPPMCNVPHKVAIIVPYRDNQQQLKIFLNHMHGFLRKQKIGYGIFLVKQKGIHAFKYFNRGMVLNAGFMESQKQAGGWQCFIFHDIDLLPLDLRNIYSCPHPKHPRHHAAFIQNYNISIPNVFGGVLAFTEEQFINVNGFSNRFWGTGGEDDDMFHRLSQGNYSTARYNQNISQYASFGHEQGSPDLKRNAQNETKATFKEDGLSNLTYRASKIRYPLYTFIMVDLDLPNYLIETDITH